MVNRRQPQRGVRPVPVRVAQRRGCVQDAGYALVGQGLSGTIDLQTVRPLNYTNNVGVVSLHDQHNS
jgi:hypothetical protein